MTTTVVVTGKGQFTLNKGLLAHLRIKSGDKVFLKKLPDNSVKIESEKRQRDIMRLAGSVKTDVKLTDQQLKNVISSSYAKAGNLL